MIASMIKRIEDYTRNSVFLRNNSSNIIYTKLSNIYTELKNNYMKINNNNNNENGFVLLNQRPNIISVPGLINNNNEEKTIVEKLLNLNNLSSFSNGFYKKLLKEFSNGRLKEDHIQQHLLSHILEHKKFQGKKPLAKHRQNQVNYILKHISKKSNIKKSQNYEPISYTNNIFGNIYTGSIINSKGTLLNSNTGNVFSSTNKWIESIETFNLKKISKQLANFFKTLKKINKREIYADNGRIFKKNTKKKNYTITGEDIVPILVYIFKKVNIDAMEIYLSAFLKLIETNYDELFRISNQMKYGEIFYFLSQIEIAIKFILRKKDNKNEYYNRYNQNQLNHISELYNELFNQYKDTFLIISKLNKNEINNVISNLKLYLS